jgi:Methane oxygenase PmoA
MTTSRIARGVAALVGLLAGRAWSEAPPPVDVRPLPAERRVDVTVGGKPFTSYIWPERLAKPVLYPIRTTRGTLVTRGFPLDPRPGERVDHPHHVGLWFNYGDVNGLDFWNNSNAIPADRAPRMGTVVHKRVIEATSGRDKGELNVEMDWVDAKGTLLLKENTRFVFRGDADSRTIDRITRLTAMKEPVIFGESKEGVLGIRVARSLEQPSNAPDVFTDATGQASKTKGVNNEGVTGSYTGSDGKTGDAVWGTRGPWTMLKGKVESEQVTLAILDHPQNPGHPTYWHARGYGLFAANNLAQNAFDPKQAEVKRTIAPGESMTFRHRILIVSGDVAASRMNSEQQQFAAEK